MTYLEIFLLALALSVDACVVSFSYGLTFNQNRLKTALLLAGFTGFFQGLMPILGYYLTNFIKLYIAPYASLIVFTIFIFLGVKFIKEAIDGDKKSPCCIGLACLFLIGVATSIDAFSAGISLALYGNLVVKPALLIMIVTFINSLLGFMLGGKLKNLSTKGLEITAGIVLIGLGLKALF
jgi:putative Mn2+ efflux pump MntP